MKKSNIFGTRPVVKSRRASTTGFTLIELLVVVAIIGLLLGITTDYLSNARSKGSGAGVKQNLNSLRTDLALWQTNNNNSNLPCNIAIAANGTSRANQIWAQAKSRIGSSDWGYSIHGCAAANTNVTGTGFIFVAKSGTGKYWCVDSNNAGKEITTIATAGLTAGAYTNGSTPFKLCP
ncbi:MAG: type II secretion system protein [Candidatus Paceibacterota bacterium]|jgi:prepilin-type N-terminal cleavage/methylation domain-containing protein